MKRAFLKEYDMYQEGRNFVNIAYPPPPHTQKITSVHCYFINGIQLYKYETMKCSIIYTGYYCFALNEAARGLVPLLLFFIKSYGFSVCHDILLS